jgi:predicted nucleic-acid-binding protein
VEALDTNVVVRLLVLDDESQCERAEKVLRGAVAAGGAWIGTIVLVETAWVLRRAYKFDRATTAAALRRLLSIEGIVVEGDAATARGVAAYETGRADFSDYMILAAASRGNALPLWTFDETFSTVEGAARVPGG